MSAQQAIALEYADAAPASAPIERRARLSAARFRREHLLPRRPVILTDLARDWPLLRHGTPDYFRRMHGAQRVRVLGREYALAELIGLLENSTPEKPAPYPCKIEIAKSFRALLPQVSPRFALSLPDRQASMFLPQRLFDGVNNLEIFFGGPGGRFPYLHYDVMHLHAWITQVYGEKEFVLYAPEQGEFLYPDPDVPWQSRVRNHHAPDFARWPLLRRAHARTVVIRPGETLFLPCGWWHTARSLTFTISVAFDQLGPDNWRDFARDVMMQKRRDGASMLRRACWRTLLAAIAPVLALGEVCGGNRNAGWGGR